MRIKKYIAPNYPDALAEVKKQLGDDALILNTRTLRQDTGLGEKGPPFAVEITAAVEYPSGEAETLLGEPSRKGADPFPEREKDYELKSLILTLLSQTQRARSLGLKTHQYDIYTRMVNSGLNERLASRIIERACPENDGREASPDQRRIVDLMKRVLICKGGIDLVENRQKRVAFIGPTGAGKTTTIAKLAADFALRQQKKVAMISLDTYRMGAIDQLRIYGDIMRVPVESASNRKELREIVRRHADKDLILIDTTGRCHKDKAYSGQLKVMFGDLGNYETQLVLSVTAQEKIFEESFKQFKPLGIDRVLFTKLDEGVCFGSLFNFSLRTRIPFSYFTMGQRVPEDLEVAESGKVIRLIFN
ncbi:MAG: flagellar biosynthesis protein FlhF [Nitrospinaceae bacterium]